MTRDEIIERHMHKVSPEALTGCWLWTAATDKHGYGMLWHKGRMDRAHRVFYSAANGQQTKGISVLHQCDNPACVNPDHLRAGTQAENMIERTRRGRSGKRITQAIADQMKVMSADGASQRTIAEKFNVSQRLVWAVLKGIVWNANK